MFVYRLLKSLTRVGNWNLESQSPTVCKNMKEQVLTLSAPVGQLLEIRHKVIINFKIQEQGNTLGLLLEALEEVFRLILSQDSCS